MSLSLSLSLLFERTVLYIATNNWRLSLLLLSRLVSRQSDFSHERSFVFHEDGGDRQNQSLVPNASVVGVIPMPKSTSINVNLCHTDIILLLTSRMPQQIHIDTCDEQRFLGIQGGTLVE